MGATEQHNEKTCDSFGLTASPRAQVAATAGYLQDFYEFGALLAPFAQGWVVYWDVIQAQSFISGISQAD